MDDNLARNYAYEAELKQLMFMRGNENDIKERNGKLLKIYSKFDMEFSDGRNKRLLDRIEKNVN